MVKNLPAIWEIPVQSLGWPWRRKCLLTPVFLPEKSHGQRSLAGYSPSGGKESDTTEWLSLSIIILIIINQLFLSETIYNTVFIGFFLNGLHLVLNLWVFFFLFAFPKFLSVSFFRIIMRISATVTRKKNLILSDPLYFLAVLFALYHAMTFTVSICISIKNGGESMKSCFWPLELYLLEPTIGHYFEESNHNDSSFLWKVCKTGI